MLYVNSFYIFIRNIKILYLFRYIYLSMVPCGGCDGCDDSVFKFDFFSYDSIIVVYNVAHPIPIILLTCICITERMDVYVII